MSKSKEEKTKQPPMLRALSADVQPKVYVLISDACTIGRADMCQVYISRNVVSRIHAVVRRDGPRFVVEDANSANGTFVNRRRIREPHRLKDQDLIGLSTPNALLRFEDPDTTVRLSNQLRYDEQEMRFFWEDKPIDLTPQEFRLLYFLYQNAGRVCERKSCAEAVWQEPYDPVRDSDRLDRKVSNLRRKLRQSHPEGLDPIETRRGLGYVLVF